MLGLGLVAYGKLLRPHLFKVLEQTGYHDWIGCEYNPRGNTRQGLAWLVQQ